MSRNATHAGERSELPRDADKRLTFWLFALGAAAALLIPLTRPLVGTQNGDGILTSLISTQKLTWYFWEQDRFLNFIPALASFISNIAWNLRFQIFLRSLFAYLAPLGILYFFTRSPRLLILAVALCNCLLALVLDQNANFNLYIEHNPFGTSLVLFALSLHFLRKGQGSTLWIAASLLVAALAYTTDFGLLTLSLPLIALAFCMGLLPRKQLAIFFVLNAVAIVIAYKHSRLIGGGATPFETVNPSWQAIRSGYLSVRADVSWALVSGVAAVALIASAYRRIPYTYSALLLMAGSVALIGIVSCAVWPQMNLFQIRYYIIYIISIAAALSYLLAAVLSSFLQKPLQSVLGAVALLGIQILVAFHGISPGNSSALVAEQWRAPSKEIAVAATDNHVQLVVGEFWDVWPAVFDTLRLAPQRLRGNDAVYGVTARSIVLRHRLLKFSEQKGSLKALCLKDTVTACKKTVFASLSLHATVAEDSLKQIVVANKHMLLMNMTLTDPPPLILGKVKASVALQDPPTFIPDSGKVRVHIKLVNSGSSEFTSDGRYPVRLGAQLFAADGKLEIIDYARAEIPDIAPDHEGVATIDIPAEKLDGSTTLILPLQEGITWFDAFGTKAVNLGPFHACKLDAKPWMCDANDTPLAKGM
jgi:hypothetical protein